MAYRALLFCPDEKTARTVTQVLSDLEFTVEACLEPFAAVKKLMGEHFDALVVDCDNEQNATLLFKSARNSTSNQASLAVAVVEGQAGVAKAFRIGANLVLTKPINVEQAKGTLRVARGLLRKGDPAKPGAPAAPTAPVPSAANPATPKPVAPAKPAAPAVPAAVATPRPASPPASKPMTPASLHAVASSTPGAQDEDLFEINADEDVSAVALSTPVPPAFSKAAPVSQSPKLPVPAAPGATQAKPVFKAAPSAAPTPTFGSGAASAPAPAREAAHSSLAVTAAASTAADAILDAPAEPVASPASTIEANPTTFTFGGAAVEQPSGGSKKILLIVAVIAVVALAAYFGWTYFQSRPSQPSNPVQAKPTLTAAPQPATTTTSSSAPSSNSQLAAQPSASTAAAGPAPVIPAPAIPAPVIPAPVIPAPVIENNQPATDDDSATTSTKAANKSAKPGPVPLFVKGGSAPAVHAKPTTPDAPAPSIIGMATGSSAPPPNVSTGASNAPAPVLQTLRISQGVSQGLLIKKVQPNYPRNALAMHTEGAVDLLATVSKNGDITAVKVLSGEPLLTKAASDAVRQWKYKPYLLNGEPVEIQTQVTINFKLPH